MELEIKSTIDHVFIAIQKSSLSQNIKTKQLLII